MRVLLGPLLLLLMLLGWGANPAFGHAVLLDSEPADGAVLATEPRAVVLRFSEPVRPIAVRVLQADGSPVTGVTPVTAHGTLLHLDLPQGLDRGSYLVSYRVTSLDQHPVGGSILFAIGAATRQEPVVTGTVERWRLPMLLTRFAFYVGLVVGAGGALFLLLVADRREPAGTPEQRVVTAGAVLGMLAALLSIGVHGGHLADADPAQLLTRGLWLETAASRYGVGALLAAVGLAIVILALQRIDSRASRAALGVGALTAVASLLVSGHVATAEPIWASAPMLLAHGCCFTFWLGALIPLLLHVRRNGHSAAALLERFSRLATPTVAILVLAGTTLATIQLGSVQALVTTDYGRILLLKLMVVGVLLLLATCNRWHLTPALRAGTPGHAATWLRRSIAGEIVGAGVILLATAALGFTPPPRALALIRQEHHHASASDSAVAEVVTDGRTVRIEAQPARRGPNSVRVALTAREGALLRPVELRVLLAQPRGGIEPIERPARPVADGLYAVDDLVLPLPGIWNVRVEALVSDFEKLTATAEIEIR